MKLIVGLGNPGPKYAGTRHNVGFEVIDYLAAAPGCTPFREKFEAFVAELKEGDETVLLVKPLTFMNLSGRAVRAILDFYKVPIENLIVICDDINLPLGKLRVRTKGSHGGQNGLRNIQEQLGTDGYTRLRIGVGEPSFDAVDHVLSKFKPGERPAVDDAVALSAQAALMFVRKGAEAAMNKFNAGEEKPKKPGDRRQETGDRRQESRKNLRSSSQKTGVRSLKARNNRSQETAVGSLKTRNKLTPDSCLLTPDS